MKNETGLGISSIPATPKPANSSGTRIHRLQSIEIARGIASVWVLLFHSLAPWPPEALHPLLRVIQKFTQHGWLGVHLFFAISGWCIAERLGAAHRRGESCGAFLRERALRIFPTYWVALGLLLLARLVAQPFNQTSLATNLPSGLHGWIGDLLLINPYIDVPATLMVSWSLVFEVGFYLFGAGALLARRHGLSSGVIAGLGLLTCAWPLLGLDFRPAYVLGLWPDFFAGVLVWWCARIPTLPRTLAGIGGLVTLAVLALNWPGFGGLGRCTALLTAVLLWISSRRDHTAAAIIPLRALGRLGIFSYSLYLIHVTVLSPFMNLGQRLVPTSGFAFVFVWITAVALALVAGWLLHRWVEAPVERWRKRRWSTATTVRLA